MKQTPKRKIVKTDPSDLQAPIEQSPETAMQVKPSDDPPRINPNGDPFDTMYRRQQKQ